jgi:sugar O-acyltransferase (sialic acid O-acetyltransferase NeuD family)
MSQSLIILGASGNAYDVLDIIDAINSRSQTWKVAGFLDDAREQGSRHLGFPVLGGITDATSLKDCWFINAIGSDSTFRRRAAIFRRSGIDLARFVTLVHPGASVSTRAQLGAGVCVNHGASVAGDVVVGNNVSIGPLAVIGHNSQIGDHSVLAPAAVVSGLAQIGRSCYLGAASSIRQRICVGDEVLVGMGAVVVRNVLPKITVVGNPARPLQTRALV